MAWISNPGHSKATWLFCMTLFWLFKLAWYVEWGSVVGQRTGRTKVPSGIQARSATAVGWVVKCRELWLVISGGLEAVITVCKETRCFFSPTYLLCNIEFDMVLGKNLKPVSHDLWRCIGHCYPYYYALGWGWGWSIMWSFEGPRTIQPFVPMGMRPQVPRETVPRKTRDEI